MMNLKKVKIDVLLWAVSCLYTGLASGTQFSHYESSWMPPPTLDNVPAFRKYLAERIADAAISCEDVFSSNKNVAAFGLSVTAKNEFGEEDTVGVMFPNTLYSAYYVTETAPVMEFASKKQVIAVTDLLRGTPLTSQTQKHQLCSFILWLLSKPHIQERTELLSDLKGIWSAIQLNDPHDMSSIKLTSADFSKLQHFLHCEQLFLYKMLSDDYIIDSIVHRILREKTQHNELMFDKKHSGFIFCFEVCTYNDMCLNCFASYCNLFSEIKSKLEAKFMEIMTKDEQLVGGRLNELLPINLEINVSSFRPYKNTRTRIIRKFFSLSNYLTYQYACSNSVFANGLVRQVFNPAVQQWLFFNRVQQVLRKNLEDLFNSKIINLEQEGSLLVSRMLLSSAQKQSEFDKLFSELKTEEQLKSDITTVGDLITKLDRELHQLLDLGVIEECVVQKVANSFFSYKNVLQYSQLYRVALPFAVTLVNYIQFVPEEMFFRNLFWANNIYDLKFAETEFAKLKLPKDFMALMDIIQQDVGFIQKFVLPMVQILETHGDLREFILLFLETIKYSTNIHSIAFNLLYQNILLPKVFPIISSIPDPKFQKDVLPIVMMIAQSQHVEPSILERIMQHLRNMFAIYSVSEDAESDIIQQYTTQLETLKAIPSVVATIFEQKTLLHTIDLRELSKYGRNKRYDTKQIKALCESIKIDIPSIQPQIVTFIKKQLDVVKSNLDKITWFNRGDLRDSKLILQQMLEE